MDYNTWVTPLLSKIKESVSNHYNQTGNHTKIISSKTTQDHKSFARVVNYLSMFCSNLQKLQKPIHDLTREGDLSYGLKCIKKHLKKLRPDY